VIVNVTSTGATPNDGSDDTDAINRAINQAPSGGTVLVPAGLYIINARASVRINKSLTFKMDTGAVLREIPNSDSLKVTSIILVTGSMSM